MPSLVPKPDRMGRQRTDDDGTDGRYEYIANITFILSIKYSICIIDVFMYMAIHIEYIDNNNISL